MYLCSSECREQVSVWQPNHIYTKRRLHWTWQLELPVCCLKLWRVMYLCSIGVSSTGILVSIKSHRFLTAPSLDLATCSHCSFTWILCRVGYVCSWECREQGSVWQPNHIDIEQRLRWTWQIERSVCYLNLWRVMYVCSIEVSWTGGLTIIQSPSSKSEPSLASASWHTCKASFLFHLDKKYIRP